MISEVTACLDWAQAVAVSWKVAVTGAGGLYGVGGCVKDIRRTPCVKAL